MRARQPWKLHDPNAL
ncbi:unnamed protein product [Podospora anserina S mat+]|uniref:Podospora anserina S mat+ genomic DNA chromosome 2, supercontig 2 n=2 Tax=Podospora TaxID=5144 RepID=B2B576_PODAN|nr:unnamed protein product [Podospora anserina S mat+]CDP25351.1 Putative protein of unknown function [Podospora anserina S mat+]VBB75427.1 Putative protein of unknown function [Podospora comata]